jgi:hypothetical protein
VVAPSLNMARPGGLVNIDREYRIGAVLLP